MYDYLKESVIRNEKRTAYSYYGASVYYKGFLKRIDKIAKSLTQFNIVENECVTICMPNTPESIALIYAINKIVLLLILFIHYHLLRILKER